MTSQKLATFMRVLEFDATPVPGHAWHNFSGQRIRNYLSVNYLFANFGFSGASVDVESASLEASVRFAQSQLSQDIFNDLAQRRCLVNLLQVWLDPETSSLVAQFSDELYAILGVTSTLTQIDIRLGDPLNAIDAQFPRRVLTQNLIGNAPPSGTLLL